ncbi:hypothetical protein D3C87_110610 [compost metagenome]
MVSVLAEELIKKASSIVSFIQKKGYPSQETLAYAYDRIFQLPLKQIQKIYADMDFLESIIESPERHRQTDPEITKDVLALLKMKVDGRFWDNMKDNDIVEIYCSNGIQVYRSFNMFKTTGYSLWDLNLYSWDELWERSSLSVHRIHSVVNDILNEKFEVFDFDHQEETVKEILNSKLTEPFMPRSLRVKLGQIAACRDIVTNEIRGFAVTTQCKIISIGKDSEQISFI